MQSIVTIGTQALSWPSDVASSWHLYQGDTSGCSSLVMDPLEVARRPALHRSNVLMQGPLHLIISRICNGGRSCLTSHNVTDLGFTTLRFAHIQLRQAEALRTACLAPPCLSSYVVVYQHKRFAVMPAWPFQPISRNPRQTVQHGSW